jgi:hypothetical protein
MYTTQGAKESRAVENAQGNAVNVSIQSDPFN